MSRPRASHMEKCPHCGGATHRNETWDAYACAACNVWLEGKCGGTDLEHCPFRCWERPDSPSDSASDQQEPKT